VKDFSRLRVSERIGGFGLIGGEPSQNAAGDVGAPPQHLQRGNQAVAAEGGGEPGDAGIGIAAFRCIGHQYFQIGRRAAQHFIEQIVRRLDAGVVTGRFAHFAACGEQRAEKWRWTRLRFIAAGGEEDWPCFAGGKAQIIDRAAGRQPIWRRIESQRRAPQLAVQTMIVQQGLVGSPQLRIRGTVAFAARSSYLEKIGEVIGERDRQPDLDRPVAVIAHAEPLIGGIPPQENCAQDMHTIFFHDDALV
jgi:hypothetical protein